LSGWKRALLSRKVHLSFGIVITKHKRVSHRKARPRSGYFGITVLGNCITKNWLGIVVTGMELWNT